MTQTNTLAGEALLDALERGEVRAADRDASGIWRANAWVKEGILAVFRASSIALTGLETTPHGDASPFLDKSALPIRRFAVDSGVRIVPGGSSVRRGAHVAAGVIMMPPAYVNVGAFVGAGSMVDSHALVGSCAQVGARCHVSAAAQIGGVLEPAGARPVILEDDVFVGGNCGVYEGVLVRERAVLAAGVILTAGSIVFDCVNELELRGSRDTPLEIPAGAVVVPGTRPMASAWARERHLSVACALIVKYRDARTDRATALEQALR